MSHLYKADKTEYTLDKMKAFCDQPLNTNDSFIDWIVDKFEDKSSKFVQEMIRVEKWMVELTRINSNINLKLINQFVSLVMLIQDTSMPYNEEWSIALAILSKDAPKDGAT